MAEEKEIYVSDILEKLWKRRYIIASFVFFALLVGVYQAVFTTPMYSASTVLRPEVEESGSLSGFRGQLGAAAAMAGVNIGGGGSDKDEYLAILRSRELGEYFIKKYELMPHLFPGRWDSERQEWRPRDLGVLGEIRQALSERLAELSGDAGWNEPSDAPTMSQAYQAFSEIRNINENQETGIVTLSMRFRDPKLAAKWANAYVAMANDQIREEVTDEASRALDYLNNQVEETKVAGLRETIFGLVENQLERIMLTNARSQYAFDVIDRAVPPDTPSSPNRKLILVVSIILGLVLGGGIALIWEAFNSWKSQQKA